MLAVDLRKRIEEDTILIDKGQETYSGLAKRHNVKVADVFLIHREKLERMKQEEAKEKLEVLEEEIRKRREAFKALDGDYRKREMALEENYRKTRAGLEEEINRLKQEKGEIKSVFEAQGLRWEDGKEILKGVRDLTGKLTALKTELKEEEEKLGKAKRTTSRQEAYINNFGRKIAEQKKAYTFYSDWMNYDAPKIWRYQDKLRELTKKIQGEKKQAEMKLHQLQERIKGLSEEEKEAKRRISKLRSEEEVWNRTIQNLRNKYEREKERLQKECEKLVEESKERAKITVKDAEQKKERILGEVETVKKEKGILEAELGLVRAALKEEVQKLRKKPRETFRPEELNAPKKDAPNGNVEALMKLASIEKSLDRIEERRREMRRKSL